MGEYLDHARHGPWRRLGRCVYCACGIRLYAGRAPRDRMERDTIAAALDEITATTRRLQAEIQAKAESSGPEVPHG